MIRNDIGLLIEPAVIDSGCILWACEYIAQGKHSLLRIYIDKPEGILVTDCEQVSKQVAAILDVEDPITGQYSLEVSSPGIPRPLFFKAHYEQYIGSQVHLKLIRPLDGSRQLKGCLKTVLDDSIILGCDLKEYEVQFSQIVKANLIAE